MSIRPTEPVRGRLLRLNGRPATTTAPGAVTTTASYDALNNLLKQTGAGAEATTTDRVFGYDLAGHLTSASAPGGTDTFTYDDRGQLLTTAGPSGTSSFAYDPDGRRPTAA